MSMAAPVSLQVEIFKNINIDWRIIVVVSTASKEVCKAYKKSFLFFVSGCWWLQYSAAAHFH